VLGVLDAATKTMKVETTFTPTDDVEADMLAIKKFYRESGAVGVKPEKFTTE
jgi:hypothetical protein